MPSTIPYDPALVLGNVVPQEKLDNVIKIAQLQAPADAAQTTLNSMISLKRSMDMTIQEMINMGVDVTDLVKEQTELNNELQKAGEDYGKAKIAAEKAIQPLRAKIIGVDAEIESPIDYNKSALKQLPISADTMQMNVQYFAFDKNSQSSGSHASAVSSMVSASLNYFGDSFSSQATESTQDQVNSQLSKHDISGTLVIAITCTHKTAQVYAPFILDVDKAVRAWNAIFPDDMIKTNDPASISQIEAKQETKEEKTYNILSGATYGSSFVGMVHVLNSTTTTSSQDMESMTASIQAQFTVGGWFASGTGGFGVDSSFANSAKNMLSMNNVQSHCSLVTMGIIPSIVSNTLVTAVQGFTDDDPAKDMAALSNLSAATSSEQNTMASAADQALTGAQMSTLKSQKITGVLSGLKDVDSQSNSIIDTNSMMKAMEDYIQKCISGGDNMGVPINYYLKPITKSMIARAWLAKYYPNKWNQAGAADDSKDTASS